MMQNRLPSRFRVLPVALSLSLVTAIACDKPGAFGEANSVILVAPDALWSQLEDTTYAALEPRIFTTREEKRFVVTQTSPDRPEFDDLKLFRNVAVFGTPASAQLREVAAADGREGALEGPAVFQTRDVWARGQTVTGVVLREGQEVADWVDQLPDVLEVIDERYRELALARMYATPPDTALSEELARRFGFRILVPGVYDRVARADANGDSLFILRNDNPDPSELIRSVLIQRQPRLDSLTADSALAWRAGVDSVQYNVPQGLRLDRSETRQFQVDGRPALEVTGIWEDEIGSFPAAGPFLLWSVDCPDGTYFIDAWLYAPNRAKYEYMLQLREVLGSFRCAAA